MMLLIGLVLSFLASVSGASQYSPMWTSTDKECPAETSENYIRVPVFHDLASVAKVDRIPGLNLHEALQKEYEGKKLRVFFESIRPFDKTKKTAIFIPGGPGQDHLFIHAVGNLIESIRPEFFQEFNVIAMDHRGVGCSRSVFPGEEPYQSLYMRQAASDIDLLRKHLLGEDGKFYVWGGSYGTMLSQTYALLYPDSIEKLYLWGAFSSYKDFSRAQLKYENFVLDAIPSLRQPYEALKLRNPDLAKRFMQWTASPFYGYQGRQLEIPKKMEELIQAEASLTPEQTDKILPSAISELVMPWMMRSIACGEIFAFEEIFAGEFKIFGPMLDSCSEFEGKRELFDYTSLLHQIKTPTFLYSGLFDHVTTYEAMLKISREIPDNFMLLDIHSGHGVDKPECFVNSIADFFSGKSEAELEDLSYSKACRNPPKLEKESPDSKD